MLKELELKDKMSVIIKGQSKPVTVNKDKDGFYYTKIDKNTNKRMHISITIEDIDKQVWLDYNNNNIEVGDFVVYLKQGWNSSAYIRAGKVIDINNVRISVKFIDGDIQKIAPHNLLIVTQSKLEQQMEVK